MRCTLETHCNLMNSRYLEPNVAVLGTECRGIGNRMSRYWEPNLEFETTFS